MDLLQEIASVRRLLGSPARWTREVEARDRYDLPVDPCDDAAERFCIVGAFLHLANPGMDELRAWLRLADAAAGELTHGRCADVYAFNDEAAADHAAVLRLLDRMAELARHARPPCMAGEAWPFGQGRWQGCRWPM